jgi:hypothetical protein
MHLDLEERQHTLRWSSRILGIGHSHEPGKLFWLGRMGRQQVKNQDAYLQQRMLI